MPDRGAERPNGNLTATTRGRRRARNDPLLSGQRERRWARKRHLVAVLTERLIGLRFVGMLVTEAHVCRKLEPVAPSPRLFVDHESLRSVAQRRQRLNAMRRLVLWGALALEPRTRMAQFVAHRAEL